MIEQQILDSYKCMLSKYTSFSLRLRHNDHDSSTEDRWYAETEEADSDGHGDAAADRHVIAAHHVTTNLQKLLESSDVTRINKCFSGRAHEKFDQPSNRFSIRFCQFISKHDIRFLTASYSMS